MQWVVILNRIQNLVFQKQTEQPVQHVKSTNYKPSQTLLPAKIHSISTSENQGLLFIFSLCKIAKKRTGVGLTNNYK